MYDNCQDRELLDSSEEIVGDLLGTSEVTYENSFLQPLEVPIEYYDNEDFMKGFMSYQELAGAIVALTNVGIHPSEALGFITNRETSVHNLEVMKINKDMNIEVSKFTQINIEKTQA